MVYGTLLSNIYFLINVISVFNVFFFVGSEQNKGTEAYKYFYIIELLDLILILHYIDIDSDIDRSIFI